MFSTDPLLYAVVERAYSKAHRANALIKFRRDRAEGRPIGRADEEDLPGVTRHAGDAIAALNQIIGDSPQDAYRQRIIGDVQKSRESLHKTFDKWQDVLPLGPTEMLSWLSDWEPTYQDAADEIGGEAITARAKRWIQSVDPSEPEANEAVIDRIDAEITKTLTMLRSGSQAVN